jgi:hypothetical protein
VAGAGGLDGVVSERTALRCGAATPGPLTGLATPGRGSWNRVVRRESSRKLQVPDTLSALSNPQHSPLLGRRFAYRPPTYKLIMRVRKPHGLSEVRLAVNRRATTEWQYLSEPVTATPGLTYWTNSPEFFASRSFWCFGAGEKSSWRAHVFSAGEELIPSRMFGHAG